MLTVEKFRSRFKSTLLLSAASGEPVNRSVWRCFFDSCGDRWQMAGSVFSDICKACPVRSSVWPLLVAICLPLAAHSAEVLDSSVARDDGRYKMHTETVVNAPVSKVRALIKDYRNFPRLNADIKRVEALENLDDGGIRMAVRSAFCILAICMHFDWVQDIRFLPNGDIAMTIVANQGDFREGNGHWRLQPIDGGTRLFFDIELTPKYWVPPLFGPWVMKQKLTDEAMEFAQGLETMANSN